MNKNMNLPAEYAVLSEEEMTYTQGGGVISTLLGLYSWRLCNHCRYGRGCCGAGCQLYLGHFRFQGLAEQEEQP